jgi:predicted ATP-dependent protease
MLYARLIGTITKQKELRPFHASAVAAMIDHSTRMADDVKKLTAHIHSIIDIMIEANYWCSKRGKKVVDARDVKDAIHAQIHRLDKTRELYYEDIVRQDVLINTSSLLIGQVNCLSVVKVGKFSYGHPTRITVSTRAGHGKIIDIQREIKMAGPSHNKAGLIISHFLAGQYATQHLFSLSASIAFEQIYGVMDGDSASVAEVCALLSALAEKPLKQYLAITGSINQCGEVQSVGCVNEKIEGFFDVCLRQGFNGKQGVLIPQSNVKNLMLREDVVEAARKKKFFIYPIKTIDEAVSLMTDIPAGKRNKQGEYPKNSINFLVEKRLESFFYSRRKKR